MHPYVKKSYGNKIKMYRSLVRHAINIQNSYNAVLTSIVPIIPCLKFAFYRSLIQHFQFFKNELTTMADRVRLIRFNKYTDSVSLKIQEL